MSPIYSGSHPRVTFQEKTNALKSPKVFNNPPPPPKKKKRPPLQENHKKPAQQGKCWVAQPRQKTAPVINSSGHYAHQIVCHLRTQQTGLNQLLLGLGVNFPNESYIFQTRLELQTTSFFWLEINWMIPNHYIRNGCFTKHPLKNGCLGYQGYTKLQNTKGFPKINRRFSGSGICSRGMLEFALIQPNLDHQDLDTRGVTRMIRK